MLKNKACVRISEEIIIEESGNTMEKLNAYINKKAEERVLNNHPWVFQSDIVKKDEEIKNGDIVVVRNSKDKFLGSAFYNDNSKITLRFISRNANDDFSYEFFKRRIEYALEYRMKVMPEDLNAFRIIYGEADFLPGLTVDKFNDCLVVQILSLGIDVRKDMILQALYEVVSKHFKIRGIYLRCDVNLREKEGLEEYVGWYEGIPVERPEDTTTMITENGLKYIVDFKEGQKTGFFLDQKYNRLLVKNLAKDMVVLDCCTHTGSFAMNAALGGAKRVVALDISAKALEDAKKNFALNNLDIETKEADLFDYLREIVDRKIKEFNLIILDPPAFTKSRSTIKNALKGYQEINYLAMRALPRGGYLVTASCSHYASEKDFTQAIFDASLKAGVSLRVVKKAYAAPDHSELMGVDETKYLKFFIFQVV